MPLEGGRLACSPNGNLPISVSKLMPEVFSSTEANSLPGVESRASLHSKACSMLWGKRGRGLPIPNPVLESGRAREEIKTRGFRVANGTGYRMHKLFWVLSVAF